MDSTQAILEQVRLAVFTEAKETGFFEMGTPTGDSVADDAALGIIYRPIVEAAVVAVFRKFMSSSDEANYTAEVISDIDMCELAQRLGIHVMLMHKLVRLALKFCLTGDFFSSPTVLQLDGVGFIVVRVPGPSPTLMVKPLLAVREESVASNHRMLIIEYVDLQNAHGVTSLEAVAFREAHAADLELIDCCDKVDAIRQGLAEGTLTVKPDDVESLAAERAARQEAQQASRREALENVRRYFQEMLEQSAFDDVVVESVPPPESLIDSLVGRDIAPEHRAAAMKEVMHFRATCPLGSFGIAMTSDSPVFVDLTGTGVTLPGMSSQPAEPPSEDSFVHFMFVPSYNGTIHPALLTFRRLLFKRSRAQ